MRRFISLPFIVATALGSCAPDERMPLSECDYGLYWAECGGTGEAVLGCDRGNGDCRWFTGGVTARGYAVADKPVLGGCPDGWPFSDFGPEGALRERVLDQMSLLSQRPISHDSASGSTVAFDLVDATTPGLVRCVPDPSCSDAGTARVGQVGSVVVVRRDSYEHRWELEILPGVTNAEWAARLYRIDAGPHVSPHPPPLSCTSYSGGREFLMSGVLHLNTDDLSDLDALHGRLEGIGERNTEVTFEF